MSGPVSTQTAPHYVWGDECDGWRLVDQPDISVIEERMPPGTAEVLHSHACATQLFYVLSGSLTLAVAGVEHAVTPGRGFVVTPSDEHIARNTSETDVRFLVISSPSTRGDRKIA